MASYSLASPEETRQISELQTRLGSLQFRTLMGKEGARIMRPERLANLAAGRGKLTAPEREQLARIQTNRAAISNLTKRGDKRGIKSSRTNRAVRTWLLHGKERDQKRRKDDEELRAIRALRMLGVEVDEGHFYLKGITS